MWGMVILGWRSFRVLRGSYPTYLGWQPGQPFVKSHPLTPPKTAATSSQIRPWGVRGPRTAPAIRNATASAPRMYLASMALRRERYLHRGRSCAVLGGAPHSLETRPEDRDLELQEIQAFELTAVARPFDMDVIGVGV